MRSHNFPRWLVSLRTAVAVAMLAVLTGCATPYAVSVDALRRPEPSPGTTYRLTSAMSDRPTGDLLFQEMASYLRTALRARGFTEAPNAPALHLQVNFGIGEPRTEFRTVSDPIYTWVSGGREIIRREVVDSATGERRFVTEIIRLPARRELVGYDERLVSFSVQRKFLRLTALTAGPDGQSGDPIWSVEAQLNDPTPDLRAVLPVLVAAAARHFDSNTGRQITVYLKEDAPEVRAVQGLPPK